MWVYRVSITRCAVNKQCLMWFIGLIVSRFKTYSHNTHKLKCNKSIEGIYIGASNGAILQRTNIMCIERVQRDTNQYVHTQNSLFALKSTSHRPIITLKFLIENIQFPFDSISRRLVRPRSPLGLYC